MTKRLPTRAVATTLMILARDFNLNTVYAIVGDFQKLSPTTFQHPHRSFPLVEAHPCLSGLTTQFLTLMVARPEEGPLGVQHFAY